MASASLTSHRYLKQLIYLIFLMASASLTSHRYLKQLNSLIFLMASDISD